MDYGQCNHYLLRSTNSDPVRLNDENEEMLCGLFTITTTYVNITATSENTQSGEKWAGLH